MSIRGVAAGDCLQAVSRERGTSSGWGHALVNSKHSPQYMGSDIATCHDIPYIDSLPIPPCPHKRDKEQYIRLHHWRYAFTFSMHQRPSKGCDTAWLLLLLGVCGAWADEKMMLGLGTVAWWTRTRVIIYAAHVVIYCNIRGWRWTWIQSTWENDAMAWKNINSFPSYTNFVCW